MDRRKTATYISPKIHVDRESGMKPGNIPKKPNFRREPRFQLGPDEGFAEIVHGSRSMRGSLIDISLSGMGFSLDSDPGLEAGAELTGSTVNIGGSVVRGDIILLNMRRGDGPEMRFGALFYPRAGADEKVWFSVVPKPDGERSDAGEPILAIRCGSCHRVMCLRESPAAVGLAPTVECWNSNWAGATVGLRHRRQRRAHSLLGSRPCVRTRRETCSPPPTPQIPDLLR